MALVAAVVVTNIFFERPIPQSKTHYPQNNKRKYYQPKSDVLHRRALLFLLCLSLCFYTKECAPAQLSQSPLVIFEQYLAPSLYTTMYTFMQNSQLILAPLCPHRLHHPAASLRAIPRMHVHMPRPQTPWAVICVSGSMHKKPAVSADKVLNSFLEIYSHRYKKEHRCSYISLYNVDYCDKWLLKKKKADIPLEPALANSSINTLPVLWALEPPLEEYFLMRPRAYRELRRPPALTHKIAARDLLIAERYRATYRPKPGGRQR